MKFIFFFFVLCSIAGFAFSGLVNCGGPSAVGVLSVDEELLLSLGTLDEDPEVLSTNSDPCYNSFVCQFTCSSCNKKAYFRLSKDSNIAAAYQGVCMQKENSSYSTILAHTLSTSKVDNFKQMVRNAVSTTLLAYKGTAVPILVDLAKKQIIPPTVSSSEIAQIQQAIKVAFPSSSNGGSKTLGVETFDAETLEF